MNHFDSGRHSKSQSKKSFYISKDLVELDLSSSYVCEDVWMVGNGFKKIFSNFK